MKTNKCPRGCDHTDDEHRSFDAGIEAGLAGNECNPPEGSRGHMRDLWCNGFACGDAHRTGDTSRRRADDFADWGARYRARLGKRKKS